MSADTDFPRLLSKFFSSHLIQQRSASPHTVESYRDTFRLLVLYARDVLKIPPQNLCVGNLDVDFIARFLNHLELDRGNSVRTRNVRLAAIRSFFQCVALHEPQYAALAQQVLSLPVKRHEQPIVDFLNRAEIEALQQAPDRTNRIGRRDHTLLTVAVQTGMRAAELIALRHQDTHLGHSAHVRCLGKGRKNRCIPLRKDSRTALKAWLCECPDDPRSRVFTNQRGNDLTHDSLSYLLKKNLAVATQRCPSLQRKKITPHTLRHTAAMELLQNGVDRATIALWLGHEQLETTYIYLHADLTLKEQAMAKTTSLGTSIVKYQPDDAILNFLSTL